MKSLIAAALACALAATPALAQTTGTGDGGYVGSPRTSDGPPTTNRAADPAPGASSAKEQMPKAPSAASTGAAVENPVDQTRAGMSR